MNFDLIAPCYNGLEMVTAGGLTQRVRTTFLHQLDTSQRLLITGEGTGRFLTSLLRTDTAARIDVIDSSRKMIQIARQRLRNAGLSEKNVTYIHKDIRDWQGTSGQYDAIVSNFFLNCFTAGELATIIPSLANAARSRARWLIADFTVPAHSWRRTRARILLSLMYAFFQAATRLSAKELIRPDALLERNHFKLLERQTYSHGFLYAHVWQKD